MTTYERVRTIIEQMAMWALDYRSPECHDEDVVARVAGRDVTVGCLRWAFEDYFKVPFSNYQQSPKEWHRIQEEAKAKKVANG